ncbi:MAG: LptA/OstA family protein [Alphaproteobacteria bacterium]|jgi:lipopolysaccharide export system protein LptA
MKACSSLLLLVLAFGAWAIAPAFPENATAEIQAAKSIPTKKAGAKNAKQDDSSVNLFGSHNSNAPINVSADSFVGDLASKVGTYVGNVIVIQGDVKLRADNVKVHINQGKPTRMEANGKVVVTAPNGTATGDNGIYELGPRTITMTGHVVLTKDKDVMRGTKLVMDMNTNLAHMYAQGMPGGRVQGLFVPPQSPANGGAKKTESPKGGRVHQTIETSGAQSPLAPPQK